MQVVFVENYPKVWNGFTVRYIKGESGTHASIHYLAEGIVNSETHLGVSPNTATVVSLSDHILEDANYRGVRYCNYSTLQKYDEYLPCDALVIPYDFRDLKIWSHLRTHPRTQIFMIMHCRLETSHLNVFLETPNARPEWLPSTVDFVGDLLPRVNIVYLCFAGSRDELPNHPILKRERLRFLAIPNCMDMGDAIYRHEEHERWLLVRKKQLCFFACRERGLKHAVDVLDLLKDEEFTLVTSTYDENPSSMFSQEHLDEVCRHPRVRMMRGAARIDIFRELTRSKYFVYPLVSPGLIAHRDMCPYVIIEALAHGVVVIAPPTAVFLELFEDALYYIKVDDVLHPGQLTYEYRWNMPGLRELDANYGHPQLLQRYADAVHELETNYGLYKKYVDRGMEIVQRFDSANIAKLFLSVAKEASAMSLDDAFPQEDVQTV